MSEEQVRSGIPFPHGVLDECEGIPEDIVKVFKCAEEIYDHGDQLLAVCLVHIVNFFASGRQDMVYETMHSLMEATSKDGVKGVHVLLVPNFGDGRNPMDVLRGLGITGAAPESDFVSNLPKPDSIRTGDFKA